MQLIKYNKIQFIRSIAPERFGTAMTSSGSQGTQSPTLSFMF